MSLFIARRSYILWVAFGTIFIGSVASFLFQKKFQQDAFLALTAVIFLLMVPYTFSQIRLSMARNAAPPDYLLEAAEWLRDHDASFWRTWDAMAGRHLNDPRKQVQAAFSLLAKHVADPNARGCPIANAAVELTEEDHPARKVIEAHKANLLQQRTDIEAQLSELQAFEKRIRKQLKHN